MPYLSGREEDPARALESERRLLYVALTRAQQKLFITLPDTAADPATRASRFVSEMCIEVSCAVGRAISEDADHITLPAEPGEIVRRYLDALNSSLTIQVAESPPDAPGEPSWQAGQRVRHSILGEGEIQAHDARRLHIRFADGKVRVFASDLAAPHLTLTEVV
jgi:DNA helicase-2/ATP-dependent DNA helicase PcrA